MSREDKDISAVPSIPLSEDADDKNNLDVLPASDEKEDHVAPLHHQSVTPELRRRMYEQYGRQIDQDNTPSGDIDIILDRVLEMSDERGMEIILHTLDAHSDDLNFPSYTYDKLKELSQGYKATQMEEADWSFELRTQAAMIFYHSPYPEVRAVTDAFDDPNIPVETLRAYVLGLSFMAGGTALGTFFSPRQPAISLSSFVLELMVAPCGLFCAKVLPDWGVTVFGQRVSLNPGPWTIKEQIFASILFQIGHSIGQTYYTYLVQMLPQYFGQTWVSFGYELLLALFAQISGFGFAGLLRPLVIYPRSMIWPKLLPTLALNRALLVPEQKGQIANGWKITRLKFFLVCFAAMFVWYWVPNRFFTALRLFNWMTWIAPENFPLAMVTGAYGGMGYNPIATFDWNVSGTNYLVTPFFSSVQQYASRFLSGLAILGMYWSNYVWSAYMPINSNETFNNKGELYNISEVMGDDGYTNVAAYKEYGPPFYGAAMVFGQGNILAWYMMAITYFGIRNWRELHNTWRALWPWSKDKKDLEEDEEYDAHGRMMRAYKETPNWWFIVVLVLSTACGIAALEAFPTRTPWWSIIVIMVINISMLIPISILQATANVWISTNLLYQMFSGLWFPGNPMALLVLATVGPALDNQTDAWLGNQKLCRYAKIPPRAIFRGQLLSTVLNCLIFIGMLNWMVSEFNDDGSLCTWSNPDHFVCASAVQNFSSAVMYGVFGVRNMFTLYPMIPWSMLIGAGVGAGFALAQKYGPRVLQRLRAGRERRRETPAWWDAYIVTPFRMLYWFNPVIFYAGACATWTGGANLSYHTNGIYISFIFMHFIKRRYTAWWEKYNFLLEAALDIGVAISGLIQTLSFQFTGAQFPKWWGNTIATAGVDYRAYNQKDPLLPLPPQGYFGPSPANYPMKFPQDMLNGQKGVRFN